MGDIYQNLFDTWGLLAPDELAVKENGQYDLRKTEEWDIYPETLEIYSSFFDEAETLDMLQGYIQRCIEARKGVLSTKLGDGQVDILLYIPPSHDSVGTHGTKIYETLLTAYLTALAAQRSPNPGAWQHFKGDTVEVVGCAKWAGFSHIPAVGCFYNLEESPSLLIAHGIEGVYYATEDYGDRVFYEHASKQWTRKTEDFLGLVGSEHPENEGKLRFVEVPHAEA